MLFFLYYCKNNIGVCYIDLLIKNFTTMKSMVKLVGLFLLLFVGNVSMALPELKEVCEGDDETFNLRGVFTYGWDKGDEIVKVELNDPFLGYRDLTGFSAYVLLTVQKEQAGVYVFKATWRSGVIEEHYAYLVVYDAEPICYSNSKDVNLSEIFSRKLLAVLPEKRSLI